MMLVDWMFERADGSIQKATIEEESLPMRGDGKIYEEIGYEVVTVTTGMVSRPYPMVTAKEVEVKPPANV